MMTRFAFLAAALFLITPAFAQTSPQQARGEITSKPICTYLINRSDQTIMGTIATMEQTLPSGDSFQHQENFKLLAAEKRQFCAAGPFFEGQRLELTLRTVIPLFSCKTKIDRTIFLDAERDADGVNHLSATCY